MNRLVVVLTLGLFSQLYATDLAVIKEGTTRSLAVGESMTFTLTADNTSTTGGGPLDSPNTEVVDTMPPTMRVLSTTMQQGSVNVDGQQVVFSLGLIPEGETVTMTIVAEALEATEVTTNTAMITGGLFDPDPSNNLVEYVMSITPSEEADLNVVKTAPEMAPFGEPMTWQIFVNNNGPSISENVIVTDTLPLTVERGGLPVEALNPASIRLSTSKGSISLNNDQVVATIGNMEVNELVTITIVVDPVVEATLGNTAVVTADSVDPDPENNESVSETAIKPRTWFSGTGGVSSDPVATATGEFIHTSPTLLHLKGPMDLVLSLTYGAFREVREGDSGLLGSGWRHSFEWAMGLDPSGDLLVATPRGEVVRFAESDGAYNAVSHASGNFQLAALEEGFAFHDTLTENVIEFDASGVLAAIHDSHGMKLVAEYDEEELLSRIHDNLGRELVFVYSDSGNTLRRVEAGERTVFFSYLNEFTQLYSFKDAGGTLTSFGYEAHPDYGWLVSDIYAGDMFRHLLINRFDESGRVVEQIGPQNYPTTFEYGDLVNGTRVTEISTPNGRIQHVHDAMGNLIGRQEVDAEGYEIQVNESGQPATVSQPDGTVVLVEREPVNGHVEEVTLEDGNRMVVTYGEREFLGLVLKQIENIRYPDLSEEHFTYDANGRPATWTDRRGEVWSYDYNDFGQLERQESPEGGVEVRLYDAQGNLSGINPVNGPVKNFTSDAYGNRLSMVTHGDLETTYTYDAMNRMLTETVGLHTIAYSYDDRGNLASVDDKGSLIAFTYNGGDFLEQLTDPEGNTTAFVTNTTGITQTIFNPGGNFVFRNFDQEDRLVEEFDGEYRTTAYSYNDLGLLASEVLPGGQTITTTYNLLGIPERQIRSGGESIEFSSDAHGRLTGFVDAAGIVTTLDYNPKDRVTAIRVGNDILQEFEYDGNNRLAAITDPGGNRWTYAHTPKGQISKIIEPMGQETQFSYTNNEAISFIVFPDGEMLEFIYDHRNRLEELSANGFSIFYEYDAFDRVTSTNEDDFIYSTTGDMTSSGSMSYTWTEDRFLETVAYPGDGGLVTYTYDDSGKIHLVEYVRDELEVRVSFVRDAAGRVKAMNRSNDTGLLLAYDDNNRLVRMREARGAENTIWLDLQLTRNERGDVTSALRDQPLHYIFNEKELSLNYDTLNQREDFTYNERGFRTEGDGISYTYDILGRLVSRISGSDTKTFVYNGFGYLTRIEKAGEPSLHLGWNAALGLPSIGWTFAGETFDALDRVNVYVHAPSGELLFRVLPDDTVHFYHFDETGNTIALTDTAGDVIAAYGYAPYGVSTAQGSPLGNPFTFGGQVGAYKLAPYTYLMRQRVYDSRSARFLTPDPLRQMDPLKASLYGYAAGNPLRYVDPTGLNPRVAGTETGEAIGTTSSVVSTLSFITEGIANGFQLGAHFPSGKTPNFIDGIADRAARDMKRVGRLQAKALDYLDARRMLRFYDRGRELSDISQRARSVGAKAGATGNVATVAGVGLELTDTFFDVSDITTRVVREKAYAHVYHDRSLRRLTRLIKQGRIDTRTAIRRQSQITGLLEDQLDGYEASAEADLWYETGEGLVNSLRAMVPFPLPF